MYGATVLRFWSLIHFGCTSDTIRWRKSLRIGASGPGASGSAKMSVYFVVDGSYGSSLVMEKLGSVAVSVRIISRVPTDLVLAVKAGAGKHIALSGSTVTDRFCVIG